MGIMGMENFTFTSSLNVQTIVMNVKSIQIAKSYITKHIISMDISIFKVYCIAQIKVNIKNKNFQSSKLHLKYSFLRGAKSIPENTKFNIEYFLNNWIENEKFFFF